MTLDKQISERIGVLRFDQKKGADYIAAQIYKEFQKEFSKEEILEIIHQIKETRDAIQELNEEIEEQKTYEYDGDNYVFYKSLKNPNGDKVKQKFSIPETLIDNIFKGYSEFGLNKTQQEIIDEYEIKPAVWFMIKGRLGINKKCHVRGPETLKKDDSEEIIIDESHQYVDKHKKRFIKTIDKLKEQDYRKMCKIAGNFEQQLELLQDYIKVYQPIDLNFKREKHINNNKILDVGFSDLHLGKRNTDGIVTRLFKLTNYLIDRPEQVINLMFLGDLAETLVEGGMHPGQVEDMEGVYNFDLMMLVVKTMETMLIELYKSGKEVTFIGMTGNHDRLGKNHNEDQARTGALAIYELIKRGLSQMDIKIKCLREKTESMDLGNFHYIWNHGDNGFAKKAQTRPEDILWKNGNNKKYNIIMYGDRHNARINETKNATSIGLGALAGQGSYDKRLDLHSEPSVIIIEKSQDGLADILLKRFK